MKVLLIEDEPSIAFMLDLMIEDLGGETELFVGGIKLLREKDPDWDMAIVDYWIAGYGTSTPLIEYLHKRHIPVILFTALTESGVDRDALSKVHYINKGGDGIYLLKAKLIELAG